MSASFAFVPRKVAKSSKSTRHPIQAGPATASPILQSSADPGNYSEYKEKGKEPLVEAAGVRSKKPAVYTDRDLAILVILALSDYALWSDSDLRRSFEWSRKPNEDEEGGGPGNEGFLPLSSLLRHGSLLPGLKLGHSEISVVKALRTHASDIIDVRMVVSASGSSTWRGKDVGGYEVRRVDWETALERLPNGFSRDDWEQRTLYLENIPHPYRTIPSIVRFVISLLGDAPPTRVQNITLPPHHLDKPDDQPKCKGFALVTFSQLDDTKTLLQKWPWNRNQESNIDDVEAKADVLEIREAVKFGFRVLSKTRWEEMKTEYLAYRARLLQEIISSEEVEHTPASLPPLHSSPKQRSEPSNSKISSVPAPSTLTDISAPYPLNCLVFVRNIHHETNKTTLRALFSAAFKYQVVDDGLDYVDFNKGMDSCHLRLSTPHHAQILIEHFTTYPTVQGQGLDDTGTVLEIANQQTRNQITMMLVQGKKEEVYWEKVPEKVRQQAVQKAVGLLKEDGNKNTGQKSHLQEGAEDGRRKRKR